MDSRVIKNTGNVGLKSTYVKNKSFDEKGQGTGTCHTPALRDKMDIFNVKRGGHELTAPFYCILCTAMWYTYRCIFAIEILT